MADDIFIDADRAEGVTVRPTTTLEFEKELLSINQILTILSGYPPARRERLWNYVWSYMEGSK